MPRLVRAIGWHKQQLHRSDCTCEMCGPLYLLGLSQYEADRLLDALEQTAGNPEGVRIDNGDWHGQIRYKLRDLLNDA